MKLIIQQNAIIIKLLGMNVDTFTIEKMFLELDPNFEKLRESKKRIILKFNKFRNTKVNSMY